MAQQLVDIGTGPDTGTGESAYDAFDKVNDNFTELYTEKGGIQYTAVTTASHAIVDADLIVGHNIFGVNYAGAVSITIPQGIASNKLIVINDESGNAGTNNITVSVV